MDWRLLAFVCIFFLICSDFGTVWVDGKIYTYPKYSFKKKRGDRKLKQELNRCEKEADCGGFTGPQYLMCIRKCVSSECFEELYAHDELEEGEIDVRYNSFKGCVIKKMKTR
ncbi:uncharacterized protein LOC106176061 [Lingula anatina]|uniref:Uncharacterized protein LOC106176061 n=1 Tax=Lingula anatina TaxID=7574 RepID=A0A1S3JTN4_LINAN|nr:uncharacterized protein LOC106176061 [Lingula anatina]|eukprot:XP_013413730.2 uncharacterized protein LOC106176061 [Lingula anatina]